MMRLHKTASSCGHMIQDTPTHQKCKLLCKIHVKADYVNVIPHKYLQETNSINNRFTQFRQVNFL
jgi:hypothetical protein